MAQTVAVVRATLDFAAVNDFEDFTVTDFGTPSAAIVILCNSNATNNPQANVVSGIGFWDGTNQCCVAVAAASASQESQTTRFTSNAYIAGVAATDIGTTTVTFAYECSATTNGIRLTLKVDNTGAGRYCTVILLKGVSAKLVTHTPGATNGTTAESSSIGFAPLAILALTGGLSGNTPTNGSAQQRAAYFAFGMTRQSDDAKRLLTWYMPDNAVTMEVTQLFSEAYFIGQASAALDWSCTVTTWGTDTFTTTTNGATGGDIFYALVLGGADLSFDMGTLTTSTSDSINQDVTTTINPEALLLTLGTTSNAGTLVTDALANGWTNGIAGTSTQYSHSSYYEDGSADAYAGGISSATTFVNLDSAASAARTDIQTGTVALGTQKFTIDYSLASATARKGWWLAFGAAATGFKAAWARNSNSIIQGGIR